MPDILNDIQPFLGDKNPQIKEGTLKFLHRCLQTALLPPAPPQVKTLSESLANLLGDSAAPVRDEAALGLGTLMKIVGERTLNPVIDPLEASRKAKVKEAFDHATVKCKVGSSAPKPPPLSKAAVPPKKKAPAAKKEVVEEPAASSPTSPSPSMLDDPPTKPRGKPPARLMVSNFVWMLLRSRLTVMQAKKPAASPAAPTGAPAVKKPPATTAASKSSKPAPVAPPSALDTFKYKHTPDDAEGLIADLIPPSISADFGDANWKTRLAALDEMASWLEGAVAEVDSEVIVRFIAKKGWNEKNFQVRSFITRKQ